MTGLVVRHCNAFLSVASLQNPLAPTREPPLADAVVRASPLDTDDIVSLSLGAAVAVGMDPLVRQVFNETHHYQQTVDDADFGVTLLYGAADSLSIAARVFLGVSATGWLLEWRTKESNILAESGPSIATVVWLGLTIANIKRTLLLQSVSGLSLGRVSLYNSLIDFVLVLVSSVLILDLLDIDVGMGLESVFAAGGVGALVFSLASKDLAEQIVGGFAIQAWDAFEVGDCIQLGDGTEGVVRKIGLVETQIVGYDHVPIRIPNAQLSRMRVSNLDRIPICRVRQVLRFRYADLDRIHVVLKAIRDQIQSSCPKLITDGSYPFRAVLSSYESDHIQATVDCHFRIAHASAESVENKEQVLLAIAKAMREEEVAFALPSVYVDGDGLLG